MSYASDDLTPLLAAPVPADGAMRYGQGVIVAWDPNTFANTILWRGTTLTNLPVLSAVDALTYRPGDVVSLIGTGAGAGTWAIFGRLITPGSGAAARAIDWMTGTLARQVSAQVFADRVKSSTIATTESTTSVAFTDLATVGPTVTLDITDSGKALVFLSADLLAVSDNPAMSFTVSGATSLPADTHRKLWAGPGVSLGVTRLISLTGLNPGSTTFRAKYSAGSGTECFFSDRTLAVVGF